MEQRSLADRTESILEHICSFALRLVTTPVRLFPPPRRLRRDFPDLQRRQDALGLPPLTFLFVGALLTALAFEGLFSQTVQHNPHVPWDSLYFRAVEQLSLGQIALRLLLLAIPTAFAALLPLILLDLVTTRRPGRRARVAMLAYIPAFEMVSLAAIAGLKVAYDTLVRPRYPYSVPQSYVERELELGEPLLVWSVLLVLAASLVVSANIAHVVASGDRPLRASWMKTLVLFLGSQSALPAAVLGATVLTEVLSLQEGPQSRAVACEVFEHEIRSLSGQTTIRIGIYAENPKGRSIVFFDLPSLQGRGQKLSVWPEPYTRPSLTVGLSMSGGPPFVEIRPKGRAVLWLEARLDDAEYDRYRTDVLEGARVDLNLSYDDGFVPIRSLGPNHGGVRVSFTPEVN